jgi:transcriptional regulator with XRE-family HTH domain
MLYFGVGYMGFGQWLKAARQQRGYTLRELANRAHNVCTFGYIAQLERETAGKKGQEYQPDVEIVDALATALDRPIAEARLAAGYAAPPKEPQTVDELVQELYRLGILDHIEFTEEFDDSPEALERVKTSLGVVLRTILPYHKQ